MVEIKGVAMLMRSWIMLSGLLVGMLTLSTGTAEGVAGAGTVLANGEILGAGGAAKYETPGDDAATNESLLRNNQERKEER